jgi:carboxypeptidase PM20D1
MIRKGLIGLAIALALFVAALFANAQRLPSRQMAVEPVERILLDEEQVVARLVRAVQLQTVSNEVDATFNQDQFLELHRHLQTSFPLVHAALKREVINELSLLYTWEGSDSTLKPGLMMAHMDVVPVDDATQSRWSQPPFSGAIADGFVWGRGAWDNKSNLFSMLEAVEVLLKSGFRPKQTIYFLFGADEESVGARGDGAAATLLKARGVKLDFVLDEGLVITEGLVPGMAKPAALIGVSQKGYVTTRLSVTLAKGGHASAPPRESVIGILANGLARLEQQQYGLELAGVPRRMLETLAPEMTYPNRLFMSNLWLFAPLVTQEFAKSDASRAQLHTTTALTIVSGGVKENIVPATAYARINFRIMPGETSDGVVQRIRSIVADDRIDIEKSSVVFEPGRISNTESASYKAIEKAIRQVFPGAVVSPGLFTAHADAAYFDGLADNVYRFTPVRLGPNDAVRFHGIDERVSIRNYFEMINFYHRFIGNVAG